MIEKLIFKKYIDESGKLHKVFLIMQIDIQSGKSRLIDPNTNREWKINQ